AAAGSKSLIHLEGLETEEQMKRLISWRGERNVYSNFQQLLDQQPKAETDTNMMPPPPYGKTQWELFTKEDGRYEKVRFAGTLSGDNLLTRVVPVDFKLRPETEPLTSGADLERLLKPLEEAATGVTPPSD